MAEVVTDNAPRLVMRSISKRFGATVALDNVDLEVRPGEVRALLGENGAGKSTLMKVLSGAISPDSGSITLDGRAFAPRCTSEARSAGVAMIYQELSMAPHLTVAENIALGVEPGRYGLLDRRKMRDTAVRALEQLGHSELDPGRKAGELPVALQQVVEIARAIASGCRVLVLDEPTSSLAIDDVERLFQLVARLKENGHAVVYISHFIDEARRVADTFTVLRDGRVASSGRTDEATVDQIIELMIGRQVDTLYPRSARVPGPVALEVRGLGGVTKPVSASFEVRRGEVLGVAGLVGAGRTELFRGIFGLDPVRRGDIKVGLYVGPASPARRWAQGVGLLSEDRKSEGLALTMSIADNLTLSRLSDLGPAGLIFPNAQEDAVAGWIEKLDIRCRSSCQRVNELSGGNQQKVAIGRLLRNDVDVLLLDEPTRGIDVASKALIYQLIDEMVSSHGENARPKAVVMVSSYNRELLGVCDRIAVMCRGRLGPARPVEELDERVLMREASGSEAA